MNLKKWIFLLLPLFLFACAANQKRIRAEETLKLYAQQLRWNMFDGAATLLDPDKNLPFDRERLKNFRVVSYQPLKLRQEDDGNTLLQTVLIGYYDERTARQREIIDQQVWRYKEETGEWLLESGLPSFQ